MFQFDLEKAPKHSKVNVMAVKYAHGTLHCSCASQVHEQNLRHLKAEYLEDQ